MNTTLSEVWQDILDGRTSDAPADPKKGILGLLSKPVNPLTAHLARLQSTLNNARYSSYYVPQIINWLYEWTGKPSWIFQISPAEFQKLIEGSSLIYLSDSNYGEWTKELSERGWLDGDKRLWFRFFPLLLGYRSQQPSQYPLNTLKSTPEDYRREVFLLILTGFLKKGNFNRALGFAIQASREYLNLDREETAWLFQHIEAESGLSFGGRLHNHIALLYAAGKELEALGKTLNWPVFTAHPLEDLQAFAQLDALNAEAQTELLALSPAMINFFDSYRNKFEALVQHFLKKTVWDENLAIRFMQFQIHLGYHLQIPGSLPVFLSSKLEQGGFSQALYEATWDFHYTLKSHNKTVPNLEQILRQETLRRLDASGLAASREALLMSGFHPLPIPGNHSPYHGLHPDQVRPFFQLIRAVTDIDIIKIYRVEKLYRVRFLLLGEQFDLHTGDGFGMGCLHDLNTLLYEKGIPYQLVMMEMAYFSPHAQPNPYQPIKVVTLMTDVVYAQLKGQVPPQYLAGFAKTANPVPAFLKNISELGILKEKPNEDVIDLKSDPKFAAIREQLSKLEPLDTWTNLIQTSLRFPFDGKPKSDWQKEAKALAESMSPEQFKSGLALVVDNLIKGDEWFSDEEKVCGLRGLAWLCRLHPDANQLYLLQRIANRAYTKVPGGPLSSKLGNLALEGLAAIGSVQAFGALSNLKAKAKYPVYVRAIASAEKKFSGLLKQYPESELRDRVIPDHEMVGGQKKIPVGAYEAVIQLEDLKVKVSWLSDKGKTSASVPAELRRDFAGDLQSIKVAVKSIEETLLAQKMRLENSWLEDRSWPFSLWQECFLSHALMGPLVKKLIWQAKTTTETISFMPLGNELADSRGHSVSISDAATIRLWHPALAGSVEEVVGWRNRLFEQHIVQPFRQAFREVYLLTPAEEATFDHSNRFAGHKLRGNTLYSLGKNRSWTMTYEQWPLRKLSEAGLVAELAVDGRVLYDNCSTLALSFRRTQPGLKEHQLYNQPRVPLAEVPPVILSEIMRDVDLFVAVSGIGADPYFDQNHTGPLLGYWQDVAFGEKSKTSIADLRKDLLERLLPMTKIAKQCKLEGNYLHVAGKIKSYKINLGSGNILMEPNDQYLCIVHNNDPKVEKQIWLPFEGGDHTLMLILSKAFFLADDDKITESQILRQMGRR